MRRRISEERFAALAAHATKPESHAATLFEETVVNCDLTAFTEVRHGASPLPPPMGAADMPTTPRALRARMAPVCPPFSRAIAPATEALRGMLYGTHHPPPLPAHTHIARGLCPAQVVQCSHPELMHFGEPPVMSYRVFERWDGTTWHDDDDL